MLSSTVPPRPLRRRRRRSQNRRAMPQLNLKFSDLPVPEELVWEQVDDEQRQIVVEALARLITKAARGSQHQEPTND
jgi:hypothetical protein